MNMSMNKLNVKKFRTCSRTVQIQFVQVLVMDTWKIKKSRKIKKNGKLFKGERYVNWHTTGGRKCRDTGPSPGTDFSCK
jgi:hypothetical protein